MSTISKPSAAIPMPRPHMVEKFGGNEAGSGLPCPMLSVLVNEGRLKPDADGRVSVDAMKAALKSVGISPAARLILAHGGAQASEGSFLDKTINLLKLQGSSLDHKGSLGPLQDGGFNQPYLDKLKTFSSNGSGITLEDLAVAQRVRLKEDGAGVRDKVIGYAELAAFIMVFGQKNSAGVKELRLGDLDTIYKDNKLPADFEVRNINMFNLTSTILKLAVKQNTSSAASRAEKGLQEALGTAGRVDQTSMLSLGQMCPAGMRPKDGVGAKGGELTALHADALKPADGDNSGKTAAANA